MVRLAIPLFLLSGLLLPAWLAVAQQINYGVCSITAAGALTSLGPPSASSACPPAGGLAPTATVTVTAAADPATCIGSTVTVVASSAMQSESLSEATLGAITTTVYQTETINITATPAPQLTENATSCAPSSSTRTPVSTVASSVGPRPTDAQPNGDNLSQMLWRMAPDTIDLAPNAIGLQDGRSGDTAFAAAVAAVIRVNPDHIPSVLFQYTRRRDYTYGDKGLDNQYLKEPENNVNNKKYIVDDSGILWRKAAINGDGTIGVGIYGPTPNDSNEIKHPWTASKAAKLSEAYWADAWYGRLWVSVLEQSFRNAWGHSKAVLANDSDFEAIRHYRTDWLAALTGLHGRVHAYGKDERGMSLYQTVLMRCDSVPMFITTDTSEGRLPQQTDLAINTFCTPAADPAYSLDTIFQLFEPFTQTTFNASLRAIVSQTRMLTTLDDSVLATPTPPPADAAKAFRDPE